MLQGTWSRSVAVALSGLVLLLAVHAVGAAEADRYIDEAVQYTAQGDLKAAIIQLKNALQADPGQVKARVMLGALHLRSNDGAAAAKEFGRARDLGAPKDQWLPGYARALMLQGEFQAMLDQVEIDDSLNTEQQADLLALRGNAHLALRQVDAATTEYDAALQLQGGNPTARLGKAQILLNQGQDSEALEQLDQVLAEHPEHVESRLARGDLRRRMQRLDEAADDYAQAAQAAPANPRAYLGLALVHIAQRDIASAKQDLAALNKLTRELPAVNYLQALVSFQEGDYARASDELQLLLRVAPGNLQAQLLYGIVSYARSEFTIADDYLTRVLANMPGNLQVAKLLGAARLKLRQPDRAVEVLAPVVDSETADAQLLALLGTAYIQSGDNSRGTEFIQRAVELDPDQAMLRTQLAVGRIVTGDTATAISELESAVALGQDVVQADVLLVLGYLHKREFDKAIAASEALEQRMADSPIPYNLTGLAYLAQRKFDLAEQRFQQALEKDPEFLVAKMNLARLAMAANKPQMATEAFERVLAQDPDHISALMGLAALARAQNDSEAAERWLLRANRADPQALQPVTVLAEGYLRQNEPLKALNVLSALTERQADLPAVLRLKGMAQLQSGDFASAVHTLRQLTERQPALIEGWFQLARAQAAAGDAEASRASFRRAIELDTEHKVPVVWIGLGELELRHGRYEAALELAQQIKQHFPDSVYGLDIEAAAYRGMGRPEQALAAAEAALHLDGNTQRVNAFANSLASSGQGERGVAVLEEWLGTHAEDGASWASLGMLRQQLGRDEAALEAYEQALLHAEPNAVILNNMAWLYLDRNGGRAVELATRAYELSPARAEIVDTYGWVLFREGRKSDGLAALQQALVIAPRNAEIALHVAEALHDLGRDAEARPVLERIVREQPNSEFAKSASSLLARLRG